MVLKKNGKREGGFTLIELVAVVIILGILAAVIVPKYFDMTGKAQDGAYKGALNEGMARFNLAYAQYIMTKSAKPTNLSALTSDTALLGSANVNIGDYNILYGGGTSNSTAVTVTLANTAGTALNYSNGSAATITVPWPD